MATNSERNALIFVAALLILGAGVRLLRTSAERADHIGLADSAAVQRQLAVVDSARGHTRDPVAGDNATRRRRGGRAKAPSTDSAARAPSPPPGILPEFAALAGYFTRERSPRNRTLPPTTRPPGAERRGQGQSAANAAPPPPPSPPEAGDAPTVDVDAASTSELDGLPGIGPSLARRIVADREQHGPFGSLEGLRRVKGVGDVLLARLAPRVTFSGVARLP